ncbi:MAG TPA: hypothetical protein VG965_02345 [Patescibacteria group bacterium]|nr:hypothetical protein [Patescibacteria group bacterium]
MKFPKLLKANQKKEAKRIVDFYQDQIEKAGRDQIQKMVDRGLSLPVFLL